MASYLNLVAVGSDASSQISAFIFNIIQREAITQTQQGFRNILNPLNPSIHYFGPRNM